jgi:hypothetical protein
MVWVKLDDKFHSNAKVLDVGYAGAGLYALSLSYCGDQMTDGVVPASWAKQHPLKLRDQLVKAGLWEKTETGYEIPDFTELNPTRAELAAKREKQRDGGRRGALNRWKKEPEAPSEIAQPIGDPMGEPTDKLIAPNPNPNPKPKEPSAPRSKPRAPFKCQGNPEACGIDKQDEAAMRSHLEDVHWLEGEALEAAVRSARQTRKEI